MGNVGINLSIPNADTLDGLHANDFSQIIDFGHNPTDTKSAVGIPYKTTTYWCSHWTDYPAEADDGQGMIITTHYNGDESQTTVGTDNLWCRQLYITPHMNYKIWQRIIAGTAVGEWTNIADGGNAKISEYVGTWGAPEQYYGEALKMRALYNKFGDYRFGLTTDTDDEIRVDYATNADTLDGKHASDFATTIYKRYPLYGDCNNATEQGVYSLSHDSANAPGTDYYTLIVDVAGDGTWIVQTAISAQLKPNTYRRTYINGVWGAWYNIADDISNPNLLINPDFKINQRGQESYTGKYTPIVDGWTTHRDSTTYDVASKSFSFPSTTNGWVGILGKIENAADYVGKQVTFSVQMETDVDIYLRVVSIVNSDDTYTEDCTLVPAGFSGIAYVSSTINNMATGINVQITNRGNPTAGGTVKVNWAKLELSRYPTKFIPPDPTLELMRCQRYFYRIKNTHNTDMQYIGQTFAPSESYLFITLPLPTSMRVLPSISVSDASDVVYAPSSSSAAVSATAVSRCGGLYPWYRISLRVDGSFTSGTPYSLLLKPGGYIDFSAEL